KQMDNRIKLLEEILSFRMQGVEFDNGDMYVDGHKAASDVRDEFVSVTEKLMDELAQCYNVRKARVSYKVQRTINASLNAATSTRAVSSNPNFVTRQKIEIIFG